MQHGMPAPGDEHRRLIAAMAGDWVAVETNFPSPWDPRGGTTTARSRSRAGVGGLFVITDYEQIDGGRVVFHGHGVYGWDPRAQRYTMQWWDSMAMHGGEVVHGVWEADTLTFARERTRYVYAFAADTYRFSILMAQGEGWAPVMQGDYRRA